MNSAMVQKTEQRPESPTTMPGTQQGLGHAHNDAQRGGINERGDPRRGRPTWYVTK